MVIAALLCGPVLAVQAQKWIESARDKKNRRLNTFKRLMATRGAALSLGHVEALNMIDLEFSGRGKKDEKVRLCWKEYLDNLAGLSQDPKEQEKQLPGWTQRNADLLAELLYDMGAAVGYKFDKVHIRRGGYSPRAHTNLELEAQLIRRFLIELLAGQRALPLDVRSLPSMQGQEPPIAPQERSETPGGAEHKTPQLPLLSHE